MGRRDHAKGSLPFPFVAIPREVLAMTEFQMLPSSAKALMLDLMAQYTGKNNGRLCPAFEVMQRSGWTSKTTLIRAKEALSGATFVVRTRKGHAPRTTDWFGFTWWRLDYDKSMDIDPRTFPHLNFMRVGRDPNTGRELAKKREVWSRNGTDVIPKVIPRGIKTGPMEVAK
jgi:hypothetical protein